MPSDNAQAAHEVLTSVGISLGALIAGRPQVRGQSGFVFRWGEWWFEELREGGPGWRFERNDKSAIDLRVNLLLDIFRPRRRSGLPALSNLVQPISDAVSEALALRH